MKGQIPRLRTNIINRFEKRYHEMKNQERVSESSEHIGITYGENFLLRYQVGLSLSCGK